MRNVGWKPTTLRRAVASSFVTLPADTVDLVRNGQVAKGNVLEAIRLAGMMAAKRTSDLLPHCHPLALSHGDVRAVLEDGGISIVAEVETIANTGVEMEALTAVSVAALTAYDMLKAHASAEHMHISAVRLVEKTGGKSDFRRRVENKTASITVVSNLVIEGKKSNSAGEVVRKTLSDAGFDVVAFEVVPETPGVLAGKLESAIAAGVHLILTVGGTGVGPDDTAVETMSALIERPLPGVSEAARAYGQARSPLALMSRGVSGIAGAGCVLMAVPGSTRGAQETMDAVLPGMVHLLGVLERHRRLSTRTG